MTDPVPVRAVERQRITRPGEVIETERVVEFATPTPASVEGLALPRGGDRRCGCGLCESPLHLTRSGPALQALPPAPARRRWWPW